MQRKQNVWERYPRYHKLVIRPVPEDGPESHRVECNCDFMSETLPTYAEAWLAGQLHKRTLARTSTATRDPRWIEARRNPPRSK